MSSTTDFYLGRGEDAEWIGSLRGECYPENFLAVAPLRLAVTATDEAIFCAAVADALDVWEDERLGHAYRRELGWPWPWYSSHNGSWIITFDPGDGAVFATVGGGVRWHRMSGTASTRATRGFPREKARSDRRTCTRGCVTPPRHRRCRCR